jgi:hypothetical protein
VGRAWSLIMPIIIWTSSPCEGAFWFFVGSVLLNGTLTAICDGGHTFNRDHGGLLVL